MSATAASWARCRWAVSRRRGPAARRQGRLRHVRGRQSGGGDRCGLTPKLITTFTAGPRPRSTGFLPDSSRAYISAENGSAVIVVGCDWRIKPMHDDQAGRRRTGAADGRRRVGRRQACLRLDRPRQERRDDRHVNEHADRAMEVGERPWGIAATPDGTIVFTANGPSNDVSFVDIVPTARSSPRVKVGDRPWGVVLPGERKMRFLKFLGFAVMAF